MKKFFAVLTVIALCFVITGVGQAQAASYPAKNIACVIQWGAGGGTDNIMRPLCSIAEKELGVSLVMQNMTGGTGSIATQYVYDKKADGYVLLIGAENPALYDALNISKLTYDDFKPIILVGDETMGIIVGKNSKYNTMKDIIDAALANPGKIKVAITGTGGSQWVVSTFLTHVTGAKFNTIPYDSDASVRTAVMSGECDFTICKIQSGIEAYKAGTIKFVSMFAKTHPAAMPKVPLIVSEYPAFGQYMPWGGAFYGVFVKKGTDPAVIETLSKAFAKAFADKSYQEILKRYSINPLGYTGKDASNYINNWRTKTVKVLKSSGAIK